METVAETEVVVIGGGISGSSSAYELAKLGKDVILVEKGKIAGEASGRNAGGVRKQGRHPAAMPMAILALNTWPGLEEELGYPTEYKRGGGLTVALDDAEMEVLRGAVENQNKAGVPCYLVDASDVRAMVKGISERVVGGLFSPSDGHANPILSTKAYARAAEDKGVKIWIGTEVTGIEVRDGEAVAVATSCGRIRTKALVLTAGPWTALLGRMIGVTIPVYPSRIQMLVTETTGHMFDCYLKATSIYGRQTKSGNLHFGGGGPPREYVNGRPTFYDKTATGMTLQRTARRVMELLPGASDLSILRSWAGIMEPTPDSLPIVERLEDPRNAVVAAGFSGRGFGIGPGTGKVVAELVVHGRSTVDISGLKLSRFDLTSPQNAQFVAWYGSPFGSFDGQKLVSPGTREGNRW